MPEINDLLARYLSILRKTFYLDQEVDYNSPLEDKRYLLDSLNLRDAFFAAWGKFVNELSENNKARIRDFSEVGGRHSFNCLYIYDNLAVEPSGMIISISLPIKAVGFYCYKFQNISEEETETVESYFPLDDEMKKIQQIIIKQLIMHFPAFGIFEPLCSDFKISKVMIDEKMYDNIDLWQILFTTNLSILM